MIQWKCGKRKGANGGLKRRRGGEIKPAERSVCATDPAEFKRVSCKTQARGAGRWRRGAFYARTLQVRQDLHGGALIRMPVAAGQKPQGGARVASRPAASKTRLAPGSAYPHAGHIREKPQGGARVASRPAANKRTCTGERLSACRSRQGKSRRGRTGGKPSCRK